ncbi:MAG: helix-turn-helix domain-containing protein, partial [Caulobacteraceae bacterium]|nr:helix-turn-helix domain-containing protein [Caulobacteraceae bacterium]
MAFLTRFPEVPVEASHRSRDDARQRQHRPEGPQGRRPRLAWKRSGPAVPPEASAPRGAARKGGGVSNGILNLAWQVDGLTASEKLVLVALADRADDAGCCWPSLADIARRCCLSERFARTVLRSIEAAGHVTTQRCAGPGGANR